jgi:hypothetical protein
MRTRTRIWPRLAAALVMALAAGVVWGFATAWTGYLASQLWGTRDAVYEYLNVTRDGTPVITSSTTGTVYETLRKLDGTPYAVENLEWLGPASFLSFPKVPGLIELPVPWSQRIAGMSDSQRPPTSWYLLRDDMPLGRAYFIGYDERSRLRVGYLGREGFRSETPPQDEQFDLGRHVLGWYGPLASTGELEYGGRVRGYVSYVTGDERLAPWLAFLIDGDRLLEINLRTHNVRSVLESPGMLNVGIIWEQPAATEEDAAQQAEAQAAQKGTANRRLPPMITRVAVRLTDRIVVLDPATKENREFVLPESLRGRPMMAYVIRPNQLFIQSWQSDFRRGPTDLTWLEPAGNIVREQAIVLARPAPTSPRVMAWAAAAVAPVPIGWLAVLSVVAPLRMLQSNDVTTYADGLAKVFDIGWPGFVAVIATGIVLAWITLRLQRKYRRPATGVWTTFVLLLGVPGFLAYWLEHRRPKLEACASCGKIVPRDRDACAACNTQFPAPPLVGTEIFA